MDEKHLLTFQLREQHDSDREQRYESELRTRLILDDTFAYTLKNTDGDRSHANLTPHVGILCLALFTQRKNMHVLMVQPNENLADLTRGACERYDIPHRVIGNQFYDMPTENTMRRDYELSDSDERNIDFQKLPPHIWILRDHVRTAKVMQQVLGASQVDSASILFPRPSITEIREAPYTCAPDTDFSAEEIKSRTSASLSRFRDAALNTASRIVRQGGKLILAQLIDAYEDVAEGDKVMVFPDFGTHADKWRSDDRYRSFGMLYPADKPAQQAQLMTLIRK